MDSQRQHARDTCPEHLTPLELPLEERPAEIESPSDRAHMARLQLQSLNFEFVMEPTTSRLKLAVIDGSIQTDPKQLMGYAATAEAAGLASEAEAVWQFLLSNAPDATTAALDGDLPASLLSAIRDFIERDPYEFHDRGDIRAALTSFKKEPGRTHIAEMANDVRCQLLKNKDRTKHQQTTMIRATQFLAGFPDLFGSFETFYFVKIAPLKANKDQLPSFGILLKLEVVVCIHQLAISDLRDKLITKSDDVPALVVHLLNPCGVHV